LLFAVDSTAPCDAVSAHIRAILHGVQKLKNNNNVFRSTVSRYNTPSNPSIIAYRNRCARPSMPSTSQHRATSFQHIYELFCTAAKNRNITLQTSNDRISIQHPFPPLYYSSRQQPQPSLPPVQRVATYGNVSPLFRAILHGAQKSTCCVAKSNDRISSMWWPLRGVRRPVDAPAGVQMARSLRSLAGLFQHIFELFFRSAKNRHIATQASNDRNVALRRPSPF